MQIILRRHCKFCDSSTHLHGPCRECGLEEHEVLEALVENCLIIWPEDEE